MVYKFLGVYTYLQVDCQEDQTVMCQPTGVILAPAAMSCLQSSYLHDPAANYELSVLPTIQSILNAVEFCDLRIGLQWEVSSRVTQYPRLWPFQFEELHDGGCIPFTTKTKYQRIIRYWPSGCRGEFPSLGTRVGNENMYAFAYTEELKPPKRIELNRYLVLMVIFFCSRNRIWDLPCT